MRTAICFLAFCLLSMSAFGGAETIIRERAKELSNQNNVRQGVAPPTQPGPAAGPSAPAAPAQSPALLKLKADLAAIHANSVPSAAQKHTIATDFIAVAQGTKPSVATAAKFADDVSAAFSEKPLSQASLNRFVQEVDAILNPFKYPQAKPDGIFADVQAIFQANGLRRNAAVEISQTVKAAAGEVRR